MPPYRYSALGLVLFLAWQAPPAGVPPGAAYYVSLAGEDRNPGTADQPWRHLEWAMTRPFLRGGDTIHILGGTYRPEPGTAAGREVQTDDALLRPVASGEAGRPITVMAEPGEAVVLSGRRLATTWQPGEGSVYYYDYETPATFPYDHPFQVVEDGKLLFRVSALDALDAPGRTFVDTAARRIYVRTSDGAPPSGHFLEYAVVVSGIEFRGVSGWRLTGFALTGFRSVGILIANGAGQIEADQMDISYIGAHRPGADPTNGYAVAVYDTSGGNRFHDSRFHNTFAEAVHVGQTGAGGDVWERNEIRDAGGPEWFRQDHPGLYLTGPGLILRGSRVTVRNNRFLGNGYHGLILESDLLGEEGPAQPSENVIEGNVFSRNAGNGIYADGKNGAAPSRDNVLRFNLLCRNNQARPGSLADAELRLTGNFRGTRIYNNTVYADKSNGVLLAAAGAVPQATRLVNNIVVHAARGSGTRPLLVTGGAAGLEMDANDWYRIDPGVVIDWEGTKYDSLEAFASRTGLERRGFSIDPQFIAIENNLFGLRASSPLLGRGLPVVEESGERRPFRRRQLPVDLGAYPYRP
jgi:hypothetical protein